MRLEPGPGPVVRREPGFDIARLLPPFVVTEDVPLPPRALITGTEFPPDWPVWDQGATESCTAQAGAAALMYLQRRESGAPAPSPDDPSVSPSRDFLWYEAQRAMRDLGEDAGVWVRVALRCLQLYGACSDALWKQLPAEFQDYATWTREMQDDLRERGVLDAAAQARPLQALHLGSDARNPQQAADHANATPRDITPMKHCIAEGWPFVMAVEWYTAFEPKSYPKGDFPLPAPDSTSRHSGHTLLVVGYDDDFTSPAGDHRGPRWLVRNSKGADEGHDGYVSLPYEWATNPYYSHGLWTLRRGAEEDEAWMKTE